MLFASIVDATTSTQADGLEFRLDKIPLPDLEQLQGLYILTPRSHNPKLLETLLAHNPPYIDLEYPPPTFDHPKTKLILSHHDFASTPANLAAVYSAMKRHPAHAYKIAAMTHSTNDALRMLLFGRQHPDLSVICMGDAGQFARVLGPVVGNVIDYACESAPAAPGQLSVSELVDTYRYYTLNPQTALYGLIGDPVSQSIGHLHHNRVFAERGLNAVYVKMIVKPEELREFFPLAKELGFKGLSVTMPLKEKVLPFLDEMDDDARRIGAVNTIRIDGGKMIGTNTDGAGALDALGPVTGKRIVLLGAGGAARAIAFEATRRGAEVWIHNRTQEKARALGYSVGIPPTYDIVVNCSPTPLPIALHPETVAMDIVYAPKITPFLQKATRVVYGEKMFFNQAAAQTRFWLQ